MSEHALLSPSSAARWLRCHGSVVLEGLADKEEDSEYSKEGTAAHELAERLLLEDDTSPDVFVGKTAENGWVFTQTMYDHAAGYAELIRSYAEGGFLAVEYKVDFSHLVGIDNQFGTSDAIIITADGKELQIHDLKYGHREVEAVENEQLTTYAAAAYDTFSVVYGELERIRLVIHQPRLNAVKEYVFGVDELVAFCDRLRFASSNIIECLNDSVGDVIESNLHPSEKACHYCKATAFCPAYEKATVDAVKEMFEDMGTEAEIAQVGQLAEEVKPFTRDINTKPDPAKVSKWLQVEKLVTSKFDMLRGFALEYLNAGVSVPDYKLVMGREGNRQWRSEEEVEQYEE
jgi:hypothetical protein